MPDEITFTEKEEIVGYIETHSGSILIVDAIVEPDIHLSSRKYVSLDLKLDQTRIPILATKQEGRRYILLPLEAATPLQKHMSERVETVNPVDMPEEKPEESTNETAE